MPLSSIRKEFDKAEREGRIAGLKKGKRKTMLDLLAYRFGAHPAALEERILGTRRKLPRDMVELLVCAQLDDLRKVLDR